MSTALRKSSSHSLSLGKKPPKEGIQLIYEQFFQEGQHPSLDNENFWNEFFLLKPDPEALEVELCGIREDDVTKIKPMIRLLFKECVGVLGKIRMSSNIIQICNSVQTLSSIVDGVVKLIQAPEINLGLLDALMEPERAESRMNKLMNYSSTILIGDCPTCVKEALIHSILMLLTSMESLSKNELVPYMVQSNAFVESIFWILSSTETRLVFGHDCLVILTLMVSLEKKHQNLCAKKLRSLDDSITLNGFSQAISSGLEDVCFLKKNPLVDNSPGWLDSITSMVGSLFGSMFVPVENPKNEPLSTSSSQLGLLLSFYKAAYINPNFMATLSNTRTDVSPTSSLGQNITCPTQLPPANLFVIFTEYTSIIMQDIKLESSSNVAKLCFIIFTIISEDYYINSLLTDENLVFRIHLHRVPLRHRKVPSEASKPAPLICGELDLMVEFLMTHLSKKLPIEHYALVYGIVHRIICYQKKTKTRVKYDWKPLWIAIFTMLKFLCANEASLLKKFDIFSLAIQAVNIMNFFLTYGDILLTTPTLYDQLYYELIRWQQTFDTLWSLTKRYTSRPNGEFQKSAIKLKHSIALRNILAVLAHFSPKIAEFMSSNNISCPTDEQVASAVQLNYEGVRLEIMPDLDKYQRYTENPNNTSFFTSIVNVLIQETRERIVSKPVDLSPVFGESSPSPSGSDTSSTLAPSTSSLSLN